MGRSWRCDETYIVDARGQTVESHLSRTRDIAAFFRKRLNVTALRTITLDGFEPTHSILRRMGMRNEFNYRWENPVEQDHRRIKSRIQPMLGFKTFYNARRVIIGIEFIHKVRKDQFHLTSV